LYLIIPINSVTLKTQ